MLIQKNMINNTEGLNPEQVKFTQKWSWGAFFIAFIWAFASKLYLYGILLFITSFIPIVNLIVFIVFGVKGRSIVWNNTEWNNFEDYKKRQKLLDTIGYSLFLLGILIMVIRAFTTKV